MQLLNTVARMTLKTNKNSVQGHLKYVHDFRETMKKLA